MEYGVDEVGRGCLAGPLVIGLVSLARPIDGLKDSKLLSKARRQEFATQIYESANRAVLGWVWPHEIDKFGLSLSTSLAIRRALKLLPEVPKRVIIDGNYNYLKGTRGVETLIGADNLIPNVSAASIIAKEARDDYMIKMSEYYSLYGFDKHVGYGTKTHLESLRLYGPCSLHRLSFEPIKGQLLGSAS
jgi:ribonuclease HII